MPIGLTVEEVAGWALERGFVAAGERVWSCPYKDGEVRIAALARNLRITFVRGRNEMRLATVPPSRLRIDEDGLLQGAGLSASFLQRCRCAADVPPWYPEEAAARARILIEEIHGRTD